jgi:eukaryotic-like serine/threonine-protein kinase
MNSTPVHAKRDVLIHLGIILCLLIILFLGFFFAYLPMSTHHGESVTVPDLSGKSVDQVEEMLSERDLRFEISDSNYVVNAKPNTVITQFPKPDAKVKEGRKVFLTVTAFRPPDVDMPDLVNLSLRSAQLLLESVGLQLGESRKEKNLNPNILRAEYRGKPIAKRVRLPKGSRIDVVLGDGKGPDEFEIPNVVGKPLDEAQVLLRGSDLKLSIRYDYNRPRDLGKVFRQEPVSQPGKKMKRGATMTIWVAAEQPAEPDSLLP